MCSKIGIGKSREGKCRNKDVESPLKQFKKGIPVNEIQCRNNLVPIIKKSDSTPSCVYSSTLEKLISRGWGVVGDQNIQPIIKTGTNAGFCVGYCSKEFVITHEKIIYINDGRGFGEGTSDLDPITKEIPLSKSDWNKLVDLVDFKKISSLPDRIGCPGCADAPVEWI